MRIKRIDIAFTNLKLKTKHSDPRRLNCRRGSGRCTSADNDTGEFEAIVSATTTWKPQLRLFVDAVAPRPAPPHHPCYGQAMRSQLPRRRKSPQMQNRRSTYPLQRVLHRFDVRPSANGNIGEKLPGEGQQGKQLIRNHVMAPCAQILNLKLFVHELGWVAVAGEEEEPD